MDRQCGPPAILGGGCQCLVGCGTICTRVVGASARADRAGRAQKACGDGERRQRMGPRVDAGGLANRQRRLRVSPGSDALDALRGRGTPDC